MTARKGERFDWEAFVRLAIHPLKVAILEALEWIERPLSASDLAKVFDQDGVGLQHVSYHMVKLRDAGVIELKRTRKVRGSTEKFYGFPWT